VIAPDEPPEPYAKATEIAALLGVTRAYVLKLALLGKLPGYQLPPLRGTGERTRWRFRISEIEDWMGRRRTGEAGRRKQ
jgi:excisionase family DNA binding protein